jgi:glycogen debranching enzyme
VFDTALALGSGELLFNGIDHGLIFIAAPQIYLLYTTLLQLVQQVFPGLLILPFTPSQMASSNSA